MDYFSGQNIWLVAISLFWVLPWKGLSLWRAVKLEHKRWFIALLVLNTMAILEIAYLLVYNKGKKEEKNTWFVEFAKKKMNRGLPGKG